MPFALSDRFLLNALAALAVTGMVLLGAIVYLEFA
jgi:hypothetical protein